MYCRKYTLNADKRITICFTTPRNRYVVGCIVPTYGARERCTEATDAHYLTFYRRSAAMTAELPWTSGGVATGCRGTFWVSTPTATVVATARALDLSVANSVVPTMITH